MADKRERDMLDGGKDAWNEWRGENLETRPNLSAADLQGKDLEGFLLSEVDLDGANLSHANLEGVILDKSRLNGANLKSATLRNAKLFAAVLTEACLDEADCRGVELDEANLSHATLIGANLLDATLIGSVLVETILDRADLTGCRVYGASVWGVRLEGCIQRDLIITPDGEPIITVDNLEVAQFIYLLLNNQKIRHVIDSITSKVVLILGRFSPERKASLDAIRDELRKRDYLPMLFDFEKPSNRDITETVSTLAHMARFVIADITDAKSIPQELMAIVPNLPSVPVQPLLLASQREYGMFEHFRRFPWILEPYLYDDQDRLLAVLNEKVIGPAEAKAKEQTKR
jgi:hypothetical protein